MNNLEDITDAKVQAAVTRRLDTLTPAIGFISQEMNDRGLLQSSMTVQKIHEKCISLFDEIRDDMKIEYSVVLDNVFWPTESLGNRLITKSIFHFDVVSNRAQNEITNAAQNLNIGIHKQLCKDIPLARDRALTDLSLFVDGHSKVQISKKIRRAITFLPKLIGKFITQ